MNVLSFSVQQYHPKIISQYLHGVLADVGKSSVAKNISSKVLNDFWTEFWLIFLLTVQGIAFTVAYVTISVV